MMTAAKGTKRRFLASDFMSALEESSSLERRKDLSRTAQKSGLLNHALSYAQTAMSGCVGVPAELQLFVRSATINRH